MRLTKREQRRVAFLAMITANGRGRLDGAAWAAELLHVSHHTVLKWLRPETTKSANELPLWAIELLTLKTQSRTDPLGFWNYVETLGVAAEAREDKKKKV